jgi:hypothetical protein
MSDHPHEIPVRSLLGRHTFSCALTTRGAVCDCLPDPEGATPTLPSQTSTESVNLNEAPS